MIQPAIAAAEPVCAAGCGKTVLVVAGVVVMATVVRNVVDLCALTLIEVGLLADGVCDGCRVLVVAKNDDIKDNKKLLLHACMNRVS